MRNETYPLMPDYCGPSIGWTASIDHRSYMGLPRNLERRFLDVVVLAEEVIPQYLKTALGEREETDWQNLQEITDYDTWLIRFDKWFMVEAKLKAALDPAIVEFVKSKASPAIKWDDPTSILLHYGKIS